MPDISTTPFACLNSTIKVLIVDDEPPVLHFLRGYLELHHLFHVVTAATADEAESLLAQPNVHFHVCLMDLYLPDNHADRLRLIRRFANNTTFLVVSGTSDLPLAVESFRLGARKVLRKDDLSAETLQRDVLQAFFCNVIYPRHRIDSRQPIDLVAASLIQTPHASVTAWAHAVHLSPSGLRKLWHRHASASRRDLVLIRRLFAAAFAQDDSCGPEDNAHSAIRDRFQAQRCRLLGILCHEEPLTPALNNLASLPNVADATD